MCNLAIFVEDSVWKGSSTNMAIRQAVSEESENGMPPQRIPLPMLELKIV